MASFRAGIIGLAVADDFNRSEDPLSNEGKWLKPSWADDIGSADVTQWEVDAAFVSEEISAARWDHESFAATGDKHFVVSVVHTQEISGSSGQYFAIWACMDESEQSGYRIKATKTGSGVYTLLLEKWTAGTPETLGEVAGASVPVGTNLALTVGEGKVAIWLDLVRALEVEDGTYTEGYGGMEGSGTVQGLDDFKVGTIEVEIETLLDGLEELPLIDALDRNENPIGEPWLLMAPGSTKGRVEVSEGWTPNSNFSTGPDGVYWSTEAHNAAAGGLGASARIGTLATNAERYTGVWLCRPATEPGATESGYYLRIEIVSFPTLRFTLEKWTAGEIEILDEVESSTYGVGSFLGFVLGGGQLRVYARTSTTGSFTELLAGADATYTEGHVGLFGRGTGVTNLRTLQAGDFSLGGEAGLVLPPPASATASAPSPDAIVIAVQPNAAGASAATTSPEEAAGPMPSGTDQGRKGLPLPYPSILANPARLGPPRFTALERKTLGIED
jgi:hypothetical protein